ncbi:MAG: hypothetical protein CO113_12140 [Elusimicrobia bacterium CG_4_9_14_3_um_filter_62_55]|nr:MAG: hypothetical protein COR54_18845 [Elusimicrobia bacterium CG22_combo_CG10-13_8_21_14_all_63_91]PJA13886.1 MAG: hypothetical protein COX66_13980 [Elusimicrobia bacterium CG_4_10_14_0_2_um_filter_63_34]PJB24788.1 MAG: hypothetical protein CO113_12140 [Elusimicrobia bacterium CG_4_9_14_3_um_filter_62_55]
MPQEREFLGSRPRRVRIRGSEPAVKALEDERALFAFAIPGAQNIELYDALERSRVAPILVTDEQAAANSGWVKPPAPPGPSLPPARTGPKRISDSAARTRSAIP